jgi:hypothetical protein
MGCCDLILHGKCFRGLQFKVLFYCYQYTIWPLISKQGAYLINCKFCKYAFNYNLKSKQLKAHLDVVFMTMSSFVCTRL